MDTLRLRFLGPIQVSRGGTPLAPFPTEKSRLLFAYLVLNRGRLHPRDVLMGTFWGERPEAVARKSLRTALWRIRKLVEPVGTSAEPVIVASGRDIGFNEGCDYWLDVHEVESRLLAVERRDFEDARALRALREATDMYVGDLLEGVYEEWSLYETERLKALFLRGLERLMQLHTAEGRLREVVTYGTRLLSYDPLREHVHRDLMRCHYMLGDRPCAVRQFRQCERVLREELDVAPMAETTALYQAICDERLESTWEPEPTAYAVGAPNESRTPESPMIGLRQAAQDLERVSRRIRRDLERLQGEAGI